VPDRVQHRTPAYSDIPSRSDGNMEHSVATWDVVSKEIVSINADHKLRPCINTTYFSQPSKCRAHPLYPLIQPTKLPDKSQCARSELRTVGSHSRRLQTLEGGNVMNTENFINLFWRTYIFIYFCKFVSCKRYSIFAACALSLR